MQGMNKRPEDIRDDDLLTWEIQLRREGTLPPEVQSVLLQAVRDAHELIEIYEDQLSKED